MKLSFSSPNGSSFRHSFPSSSNLRPRTWHSAAWKKPFQLRSDFERETSLTALLKHKVAYYRSIDSSRVQQSDFAFSGIDEEVPTEMHLAKRRAANASHRHIARAQPPYPDARSIDRQTVSERRGGLRGSNTLSAARLRLSYLRQANAYGD